MRAKALAALMTALFLGLLGGCFSSTAKAGENCNSDFSGPKECEDGYFCDSHSWTCKPDYYNSWYPPPVQDAGATDADSGSSSVADGGNCRD
ncbi:hypothetical protein LZC95_34445 [Pendulispora brunnea]|uniref:Lipoprotein n=1 Tax=Pendulispora brunnea TaxID=2905690 RepID=A0ABZ2JYJ6_9BACT